MKLRRMLSLVAVFLAFLVVILGAFTRLTDAGLGCPDWPGCYGRLILPSTQQALSVAQHQYPHSPIESRKAWTEMVHRYAAGTLALLIVILFALSIRGSFSMVLPSALLVLVAFQAALGMWTVTLKLLPVVVMGHLLGGLLIFACLCYFAWQLSPMTGVALPRWRRWVSLGVVIVFVQIALGGWVSSNYAGIACIGFPQCNGQWLPKLHLMSGFNLFSPIGANYQGGLLNNDSRVTIQMIHRFGALITTTYVLLLSGLMIGRISLKSVRITALCVIMIVLVQFGLGVINVLYLLPLQAAVLHNAVAALLLASMVSLRYMVTGEHVHARCC